MECSCVYSGFSEAEGPEWWAELGIIPAKRTVDCCECGAVIAPGELHEKRQVQWQGDDSLHAYRTCRDCYSIRVTFFCEGWVYTRIGDDLWEHVVNIDGELSETCLSELTPGARAMVCDLIEDLWLMDFGPGALS